MKDEALRNGQVKCASPTCGVTFAPSGLDIKAKRYCCDECKMDAWAIRRVAKLLDGRSDQDKLKALRGENVSR
jgi:hypothetical protein